MSQNNAVYKGFRVSAKVRHAAAPAHSEMVQHRFLATATITQMSAGMGSRRLVPPMIQHDADTPHVAIEMALSSAREVIDRMSTFVKSR